ncbi:FAD-binding oxidoreductase [Paenibacillus sp. MMS20-IR301]|uniref:FAD-binding oxidoreductase n=1 Tax=Paenibacillus sp. MMS20-IR301 TaxID=2895946 RepID=UPI0028E2F1D3|nr:FAD-binding oxidoreductase [Paenibacillus sp. MMS20-IR301]WNS44293.1 FAD-binding oxidoreductase [Paenibacillus sp. MMS20-IR301]
MAWTSGLTGRILEQGTPGYEEARRNYNSRFSKFPKLIVYCLEPADAANAVSWAKKQRMDFRVRCGGHSYEAYSNIDGGLVIDVSELTHLKVDKAAGTARVGAGFRLKMLYEALWKFGFTLPGGSCPSVGVAGLTLGGGYGFLSRAFGMLCDAVQEIELVDANGVLIRANETLRSDLFWACCGGSGGNFGIVTTFTFRLYPIGDVAQFSASWDHTELEKVIRFWQDWAPHADSRLTSGLELPAKGLGDVTAKGIFTGLEKDLRKTVRPLQEAVPPKQLTFRSSTWIEAIRKLGGNEIRQARFKNSSAYIYKPFTEHALQILSDNLQAAPGNGNLASLVAYRGAISEVSPEATAFPHREALFVIQYQSYWRSSDDASARIGWIEHFRESMLPFTQGAYSNYCDSLISDWPVLYFGSNLARLKRVKQAYDPDNLFRYEQSIPLP